MAFKSLRLLVVIVCSLVFVSGLPRYHNIHKRARTLCGDHLVAALAVVCNGNYFGYYTQKRNYALVTEDNPGYENEYLTEFDGFKDTQNALGFLGLHRRTRGVVDECCRNPCNVAQLMAYCGTTTPAPNKL